MLAAFRGSDDDGGDDDVEELELPHLPIPRDRYLHLIRGRSDAPWTFSGFTHHHSPHKTLDPRLGRQVHPPVHHLPLHLQWRELVQ